MNPLQINWNVPTGPTANKSRSLNQHTALKLPVVTPYGILPSFESGAVPGIEKKKRIEISLYGF